MTSFIKVDSKQDGPFGFGKSRVQLPLSGGEVYDLSKSYINLNIDFTSQDVDKPDAVAILRFNKVGDSARVNYNSDFIRDVRLRSQNKGMLEEIRDVNVLRHNLNSYTRSVYEEFSKYYSQVSNIEDRNNLVYNPMNNYEKGFFANINREHNPIRIYMKDILGLGNETEFDTRALGESELELQLVDIAKNYNMVEENPIDGYTFTVSDITSQDGFDNNTLTITKLEKGGDELDLSNRENNPFFNGQKLSLTYRETTPATDRTVTCLVLRTDISKTAAGAWVIQVIVDSLDTSDDHATVGDLTNITPAHSAFKTADPQSDDPFYGFQISSCDMVLHKYNVQPAMNDGMEYLTFLTENRSIGGLRQVAEHFQCPPNSVNVLVACLERNDVLRSRLNMKDTYQFAVNNIRTTEREVSIGSGTYLDKINQTIMNCGYVVKNLSILTPSMSSTQHQSYTFIGNPTTLLLESLWEGNENKDVEIRINSEAIDIERLVVFKQVVKSVLF